jgi:hypothetical protein
MRTKTLNKKLFALTLLTIIAINNLIAVSVASAEDKQTDIPPLDPLAMKLASGEWREYRFTGGATKGSTVRWTWLETVELDGRSYQWFETQMNQTDQKMLSRILGSLDNPTEPPIRVIMQTAQMPPREMPEEMRLLAAPALKRNLLNPPSKLPDTKNIEVPAGKFTTTVYESSVGGDVSRTYYSTDLPGMISYEASAGGMELIAYGSDGKTAIEGEVTPYTPLPRGVKPGAAPKASQ